MRFPGFIGPSYTLQSVNVDCQRCVNLFPEINALGTGKEREVAFLAPTPGLLARVELAESPVRGVWRASNDRVFAVGGSKLYEIDSSWTATERGTLSTSEGHVSMSDNGVQLGIVDGTAGYTHTFSGNTFAVISDGDFPNGATTITFQDGYFIVNAPDTSDFYISALNDGTSWDALDLGSAEGSPDPLVGVISCGQNLYGIGTQSTEIYYNSGDADFPFTRVQGAISEVGCIAAHTIQKLQGAVYLLGGDSTGSGIVYRMEGYRAERISTPAIEAAIREYDVEDLADSRAWVYQQGGHLFYCLNLAGADTTWCYDASTQMWHERQYLGLFGNERHRADCHALAFGQNIVGDYETGDIYSLDADTYTDDENYIPRIRTAPHLSKSPNRLRHNSFQLDMETGVGLSGSGQGSSPVVMMRFSDDGGHTWSNEYQVSAGAIGAYSARAIWRRLGSSRDRVYEVKVTDPVKTVFIGADLGVEEGAA